MNFLITGGAGSVGRDLTASLLSKGYRVRVFDRKAEEAGFIRDDRLEVVPAREWKEAQFLADSWELSTSKAEQLFGCRSLFSSSTALQRLKEAIEQYRLEIERKIAR